MRPWERIWFNYWAARNIRRKDRPIHRIERALLIWPLHAWIWAKQRRTPAQPSNPSAEGFSYAQKEDS